MRRCCRQAAPAKGWVNLRAAKGGDLLLDPVQASGLVVEDDERRARSLELSKAQEAAGRKRGRSTESVLGGPELCGPVEDRSGVAFTASDESRGGPAALRHYREARGQVDWVAVGEKHYGSQGDEHGHEPPEAPRRWWHGPNRDQGLEDISARAAAIEAQHQASSAPATLP